MRFYKTGLFFLLFVISAGSQSFVDVDKYKVSEVTGQMKAAREKVDKALPKTIIGTSMFALGEALGWIVVYPKDKEIEEKLFDDSDGSTYTERAEDLLGESMQVTLLNVPFRVMTIGGVTMSCIAATKSKSAVDDASNLSYQNVENINVWGTYIAGWVAGSIGSALSFAAGSAENRGLIKAARVFGAGQSLLWTLSNIFSIVNTSKNKKLIDEERGVSIRPVFGERMVGALAVGEF